MDFWTAHFTDPESNPIPEFFYNEDAAYWAMTKDGFVYIEFDHDDRETVLLTNEQMLYILAQYKIFLDSIYLEKLEKRYLGPTNPPDPIDVEFIAEGPRATELFVKLYEPKNQTDKNMS